MGGGIAQVLAASGRHVSLHDPLPGAPDRAIAAMERSLTRLAEKGGADPHEVLGRIEVVAEIVPADLMIEAVVEDPAVKEDVFRRADGALPEHAVLASNTSSIPIASLATATGRADRVIGMHFFNPVPVLKLVEVIPASSTSEETTAAIVQLARDLGKEPVRGARRPGIRGEPHPHAVRQRSGRCARRRRRVRRGDRHGRDVRVRPSAGTARARGPDRARHRSSRSWRCSSAASATRSTRRIRFCGSTSRPAGSAGSRAADSSCTADPHPGAVWP